MVEDKVGERKKEENERIRTGGEKKKYREEKRKIEIEKGKSIMDISISTQP